MASEDHEWVRQTLEGDSTAFDRLMEKYMPRAYRIAYKMASDPTEAEDLTQEAFLKAYKGLKGFRAEASFYTWFCRILVHLCQDHLRKKRFRSRFWAFFREESQESRPKTIETDIADPHWRSNPTKVLEQAEWGVALEVALSSLPVRQKTAFVLRHFQDLKVREISKVLGISEGTVKSHLFRAVKSLRQALEEEKGKI